VTTNTAMKKNRRGVIPGLERRVAVAGALVCVSMEIP
jgi:hypothetical protein